jgi:hypothetical protein
MTPAANHFAGAGPLGVMSESARHTSLMQPLQMRRTSQERANRATRRAAWTFLLPLAGVPVFLFYFYVQEDLVRAVGAAAATGAIALLAGPLMLWWSVSGMRRGSRHLLLGMFTGLVGAFLSTALCAAVVGGGFVYALFTGEPIPGLPGGFDATEWVFLSPENPLNPNPLAETLRSVSQGGTRE